MNNQLNETIPEILPNERTAPPLSMASDIQNSSRNTQTVTLTQTATRSLVGTTVEEQMLPLTLRARPHVTWDESVEDNEGLGRKTSKRCCIFHKQRDFGESSTDSSDDSDGSESSSSSGGGFPKQRQGSRKHKRRIARPKKGKGVPDYQRYHA